MGLDITIKVKTPRFCPHCNREIESWGKEIDRRELSGRGYYPLLDLVGYTDDDYGTDKCIDKNTVLKLAREINKIEISKIERDYATTVYNWLIEWACEMDNGYFITLEADW